ncbi:site-specific integrase [Clostridium senegalense]|uniref:site-specific integrase n=1 Tax=Clostridium senegalense TaxID=1465809 RepID=UPI001C11A85C|nr:site-specific integrase [Clostridium senegalense]MBU5227801.1 site-specific integrase [Clostridium senegalense]
MDYNITYRQKDKGWQFIISYKVKGKWKQKSRQGFSTKKEAKPAAEKMLLELKENENLNAELRDITFAEFKDMYMEHIKLHMQGNTIAAYNAALKHFRNLDNTEMNKITNIDVQNCIDNMIKINLSYGAIKTYTTRIKTLFNSAANKYNVISKSPAVNVELKVKKEQSNKKALTESELKDLINRTKNFKYKAIFALAGMCGLRAGEILGLQWNNVNFKDNIIKIDFQWKKLDNGTIGFGELKSKNSYRTIPMPSYVKELLLDWVKYSPIDETNRVFLYKSISTPLNSFSRTMRTLGYNITIHELRHTYATTLISNGLDFKTVATLMGHDVRETMNTYSHVTNDMMNNAISLINKIF